MTFRRTAIGLSNEHFFLDVDAIVFVEGGIGISYTKQEIYNGYYDDTSIDITFWRKLFSIYQTNKKLQFRAIGSKATLRSIAEDVRNNKIKNVYVAMDRDYDVIYGCLVHANGIIYTYGYSWENDVWHPEIVQDVFNTLCINCPTSLLDEIQKKIAYTFDKFVDDIKIAVFTDAILCKDGTALIPRNKHMCCLKLQKDTEPFVNIDKINELLNCATISKEVAEKFGNDFNMHPQRDCYGHLLSDYCYHLIKHFLKNYLNLPPIPKAYITGLGIDKFVTKLASKNFPEIDTYYREYFSSPI